MGDSIDFSSKMCCTGRIVMLTWIICESQRCKTMLFLLVVGHTEHFWDVVFYFSYICYERSGCERQNLLYIFVMERNEE